MKNKGCRTRGSRTSAAKLLETPSPEKSPKSPKSAILTDSSSKRSRKKTIAIGTTSSSAALFESPSHSHFPPKTFASISDLKQMASSRLDDLKRHVDHSHSQIVKDLDAFHTRLHKRFKIQNEACQKVSDEAEKEHKKISERISQSQEAIMSSYVEFMADVQANASIACKTSITKLSQSFEKAIDGLRSRYGVSSS
ncbi:uncharacterized protein LOC107431003 [Ziziphus jujuba]|uniref:Uncharacterized protein LOC107431003 n=1 Tax=Ziziphus jujuba TaxID=326968 RepID=A0A6P4APV4_ZIZJJ|nr:uncharacterized protein LOC107431003 [Ziziphus jujuba]